MNDRQRRYFLEKEERRQSRLDRLRFAAGMAHFVGVILGAVLILILILLLLSLASWLRQDIASTFTLLDSRL